MIHFLGPGKRLVVKSEEQIDTTLKAFSNSQKCFHNYLVLFCSYTQKHFLESEAILMITSKSAWEKLYVVFE